jgi:hypothetical protein
MTKIKNQLLLGCGHARRIQVYRKTEFRETPPDWENLYTLDINMDCKPDLICNLDAAEWDIRIATDKGFECCKETPDAFVLRENFFDEIHAYEVLEHLGRQGFQEDFFSTFSNLYRALVPGGLVLATCPSRFGGWLWGDPGHRRVITPESLVFLDQEQYATQAGKTAMSDYRYIWQSDFKIIESYDDRKNTHSFVLEAIKPARSFSND